jgi:hypothetical protein
MAKKKKIIKFGINMTRYAGDTELSLLDRMLNKIEIDQHTDCWLWVGGKNNLGYGFIRDGKKMRTAHRASYEEHLGPIPKGMCVCHSCDNPLCINPSHLWLGTRKQNTQDMMSKGRDRIFGSSLPGGKSPPVTTCIHCNKTISKGMHGRYHGDKCKLNKLA